MITTSGVRDRAAQPPLGLLLRRLDRLIDEQFERTLGGRGVTRRQWQLLNSLTEGPTPIAALDDAVAPFLDRVAGEGAAQHLSPLAEQGVLSVTGEGYELTESGRRLVDDLAAEVRTTRELTARGITDGEYERTIDTLQTMVQNLEAQS